MEIMDLPRKLSTKLTLAPKALASVATAAPRACLDTTTNLCEGARGPGIYNRLAVLSMNGKIDIGDYGVDGNAAEYTLTGRMKVNRDVLGLRTDYDKLAAEHRKKAAQAGNSEQGRKQNAFAQRALNDRRRELLSLSQALVHEAAHAYYGFSLSKSNDEFDAYSVEAMWNAHLWRTLPEDRRIIEGIDSNTISGSQAATKTPVFSKIPRR